MSSALRARLRTESESSELLVCSPAFSLEAAASRASSEGVASPKTVVKDERIAIKYAAATFTRTRLCEANFKGPPGF